MFVPIRLARTKGLFNELINPGVDVGFGLGLDLGLGPAQPYRDGVRCHTMFVSHCLAARKTFIRLGQTGRNPFGVHALACLNAPNTLKGGHQTVSCATPDLHPHAAGQQVVRETAFEGVEFGNVLFVPEQLEIRGEQALSNDSLLPERRQRNL